MALDSTELTNKVLDAISQNVDGNGLPIPAPTEMQEYCSGIVAALKSAVVSHAPGTITGTTAPGAPLSNGAGSAGIIVITPAPMIAKTTKAMPDSPKIITENTALIQYIGTGLVAFAAGNITGNCTSTPINPGPLVNGAGSAGTIMGLTGVACAGAVAAATGLAGPEMITIYTVIMDYISQNAEVSYAAGTVQGTCPAGGGPLAGGFASGGVIS